MRLFTDNITNLKTFNGYYLLACDGSNINISYNFSSFITNNTILDQQEDKYKINFHVAITNIRSYLKNEIDETNLIEKLLTFAKDLFSWIFIKTQTTNLMVLIGAVSFFIPVAYRFSSHLQYSKFFSSSISIIITNPYNNK